MGESESEVLTSDDIFEILSNHRRRMVLYHLQEAGTPIAVNELAEHVAAMENEVSVDQLSSQQRKRVYVSLYQTHLPKMAQMDLIEYDQEEGMVALTSRSADINRYLGEDTDSQRPWRLPAMVLGALVVALGVIALVDASIGEAAIILAVGATLLLVTIGLQYWLRGSGDDQPPNELRQHEP